MRWVVMALAMALPVQAHAGALVCLFEPTKERFNIIWKDNSDYIQWGGGPFTAVNSRIEEEYLIIEQYGEVATFRMVWHPKTGQGYGGVVHYNGQELKGKIICAVQ